MIDNQLIVNVTPQQAAQLGCNMFQLYYPGNRITFSIADGKWEIRQDNKPLKTGEASKEWTAFLLGVHNPINEKVTFYDCWQSDDLSMVGSQYRNRVMLLKTMTPWLLDWMSLADNYRITDFEAVWKSHVESGQYPGVIFRKSSDTCLSPRYIYLKTPTNQNNEDGSNPR